MVSRMRFCQIPGVCLEKNLTSSSAVEVDILLGTGLVNHRFNVSPLAKAKRELTLESFGGGGEIGLGGWSPVVWNNNSELNFKFQSNKIMFEAPKQYELAIMEYSPCVSAVVDTRVKTAWLVPYLSWLLHMCQAWYNLRFSSVPFAATSTDVDASRDALLLHRDDKIGEEMLLRNVVHLMMLRIHQTEHKLKGPWLQATDARDLVQTPSVGFILEEFVFLLRLSLGCAYWTKRTQSTSVTAWALPWKRVHASGVVQSATIYHPTSGCLQPTTPVWIRCLETSIVTVVQMWSGEASSIWKEQNLTGV